jgi:conjugal transfer pilin signal peptidase TrbI
MNHLFNRNTYCRLSIIIGTALFVGFSIQQLSEKRIIAINVSNSLPQHVFWVTHEKNLHVGDYAAFWPPPNKIYSSSQPFIKQVAGVAGDTVHISGNIFYVNHRYIGQTFSVSSKGLPLEKSKTGTISAQHYFMYSPHPRSFDSRYAEMGWIDKHRIIGRAVPLF